MLFGMMTLLLILLTNNCMALGKNFTYLEQHAPSIMQEIRYAGENNFVGRPINGYLSGRCILTKKAAKQLAKVQQDALSLGYSLKVYDCYRPQMAVNDFKAWARSGDNKMKNAFYPNINKRKLFKLGYIASYSGHSRGSTVDITLVPIDESMRADDHANHPLDMGTPYDFMDKRSHVFNNAISREAKKNRMTLRRLMLQHGFKPYNKEWWHFSLRNELYRRSYFNFAVQ